MTGSGEHCGAEGICQQRCAAHPRAQRQGRSLQRWARGQAPSLPTVSVSLVPRHGDARQQVGCWSGPRRKGMHWLSWPRGRQPPGRPFLPGGDGMAPSRLAADGGVSSGTFTLLEGRMLVRRGRASCVPVMMDMFASQAAPWELAPRSRMQAGALRRAAQQGQLSNTQLCLLFPGVTCGEGRTLQRHHVGRLCAREGGQGQRGQVGKVPRGGGLPENRASAVW